MTGAGSSNAATTSRPQTSSRIGATSRTRASRETSSSPTARRSSRTSCSRNGIAGDGRGAESYYGYEHDVRWNGQNYKPDFSIYDQTKKRRIVIEYFGLQGDPDYDQTSQAKREFWAERDEVFLEYFPSDIAKPGLRGEDAGRPPQRGRATAPAQR